jgi:predicted amidophosphoribosyltransferase
MSFLLSCPNCKAQISSTVSICEWCGTILNRDGVDAKENIQSRISKWRTIKYFLN